jgi:hypothetical protein
MFRQGLFSVAICGLLFTISGSPASAQGVDKWGIPCPTGGCAKMISQMKQHQKLPQAEPERPTPEHPDARGWDGVGQDPDKIPFSKDTPDPDDADMVDQPSNGSVLGHRNIPK